MIWNILKGILGGVLATSMTFSAVAQRPSTVKDTEMVYVTYPFSDPDPVANVSKIYPYFRYDGFTSHSTRKIWKVVALENDYISVQVMPEIGGKIWTAIDKKKHKPFIYDNDVVKFRDIAMRGPWTSGGIEANFGILGHTPAVATPVDYMTRTNRDGSASCIISVQDLLTGSRWEMEIRLPEDKAYFITRVYWHNASPVQQAYYSWMNLAEKVSDSLVYLDPGNHYIGHDGSVHPWHFDTVNHRDLAIYAQNNFGPSKSYHVLGTYSNYFGAYWQKEDFGMIHYAEREQKLGKKVWIWSLSEQGSIWKDQLTDRSGQYTELQSGRLFSQNALASSRTPFKQVAFSPYQSDRWAEYWYPFSGTGGLSGADLNGVTHLMRHGDSLVISFSAVSRVKDSLRMMEADGRELYKIPLNLWPLDTFRRTIAVPSETGLVLVCAGIRIPLSKEAVPSLDRPLTPFPDFDWESAYGLYRIGRDEILYHEYAHGEADIRRSLAKDPAFPDALTEMSLLQYRKMRYDSAYYFARRALRIDTYDPRANYYYGLAATRLGRPYDALDGFELATLTTPLRSAAYTQMSQWYMREGDYEKAFEYASRSLESDVNNVTAYRLQYLSARLLGDADAERRAAGALLRLEPLNHFVAFERYWQHRDARHEEAFKGQIRNELPAQTYLDLLVWYRDLGRTDESELLAGMAPANNLIDYWNAYLHRTAPDAENWLKKADAGSPLMQFPFREQTADVMRWAIRRTDDWKPRYYLAMVSSARERKDTALVLLKGVRSPVDFAPFYVTRALLRNPADTSGIRDDFSRAVSLDGQQWRYRKYLAEFYLGRGQEMAAMKTVERYYKTHPENYMIGMVYVRCLMSTNRYQDAETALSNLRVLPYEGTTYGRKLYEQTKLMLGLEALKKGNYRTALQKVKEAGEWPMHLGVGKPYPDLINTKREDSLRGLIQRIRLAKGKGNFDYGAYEKSIKSISGN